MKDKKRVRPNPILYHIFGQIFNLIAMSRGQKIIKKYDKLPKAPFIYVSNHTTFYDFAYLFRAAYPSRCTCVMAAKYNLYSLVKPWFKVFKTIPKALFDTDTACVKAMIDAVKAKGVIAMCPEGQIPYTYETLPIAYGLGKFVKKYNLPVVSVRTKGGCFADPSWAYNSRNGAVITEVFCALTREEIESLTAEEIEQKIFEAIKVNQYEECRDYTYKYKGKNLCKGLDGVLYLCPKCKSEHKIKVNGNLLKCSFCHFEVESNAKGEFKDTSGKKFEYDNISKWTKFLAQHEQGKIQKSDFELKTKVEVWRINKKGKRYLAGQGEFSMDSQKMAYAGDLEGERVSLDFAYKDRQYLACDRNMNFQIYIDTQYTEFRPENPRMSYQIALLAQVGHLLAVEPAAK